MRLTPDVLIPDTTPLIHLAAIGQLGLLHRIGRVVVPDMVKDESIRDLTKPWARELRLWFEEGERPGSNAPITVPETETGKTVRLARRADPAHRQSDAGERAIVDWLAETLTATSGPPIILYENSRIPNMIVREGLAATVIVTTTRSLLAYAQEEKLITPAADGTQQTAEALWEQLILRIPTANPVAQARVIRPVSKP